MFRSIWSCLAAFVVLLCSLPLLGKDEHSLPDELFSAKSRALIVRVIGEPGPDHEAKVIAAYAKYRAKIESKALAEIQKKKYFQFVSDPSKADLVYVLIAYWAPGTLEGKSSWSYSGSNRLLHPPEALMVFKGGNSSQSNAFPLWMKTGAKTGYGTPAVGLLEEFHSSMEETMKKMKTKPSPGAEQRPSGNSITKDEDKSDASKQDADTGPTSAGGVPGEVHSDSAQKEEKDNSIRASGPVKAATVFCQSDFKACSLPQTIYSAKTLLICDSQRRCNTENVQKALQPELGWTLVTSPEKADLIMILSDDSANDTDHGLLGLWLGGAKFSTMYLFKGGVRPDWQAIPLFTTVGGGGMFSHSQHSTRGTILEDFQKFLAGAGPAVGQPTKQQK
jgi:hypothetical protein